MAQKEHREYVHPNPEGRLGGIVGPAWALMYTIFIALLVIVSVFLIGDPNPLG